MAFNCIIDDYVNHERYSIMMGDDQMTEIRSKWYEVSDALKALQSIDQFAGKTRWCEVDAENYRILMTRAWVVADNKNLDTETRVEAQRYFYFLLTSYVVMLEMRTGIVVDVINIARVAPTELTIKVTMCMMYGSKKPVTDKTPDNDGTKPMMPKSAPKLSIIVNNE